MRSPDAGLKTAAPLAMPQNYFEASFDAPANTPYHIWLRLRAANNSAYNDSVMVQLSDSLNTTGSARVAHRLDLGLDRDPRSVQRLRGLGMGMDGRQLVDWRLSGRQVLSNRQTHAPGADA